MVFKSSSVDIIKNKYLYFQEFAPMKYVGLQRVGNSNKFKWVTDGDDITKMEKHYEIGTEELYEFNKVIPDYIILSVPRNIEYSLKTSDELYSNIMKYTNHQLYTISELNDIFKNSSKLSLTFKRCDVDIGKMRLYKYSKYYILCKCRDDFVTITLNNKLI